MALVVVAHSPLTTTLDSNLRSRPPRDANGVAIIATRVTAPVSAPERVPGRILDKIELQHYDVFAKRARVATWEKAAMVARLAAPWQR